jgi:4-hydroxy-4-methyl-2-oxoglutarate aldolase
VIELTSALVASAGRERVGVITGLMAAWPQAAAAGPALTVRGAPNDNLALHRALAEATAGEVIVLAAGEPYAAALCGELLALAARRRGIAGLVVDGAVRDLARLTDLRVRVFFAATSPAQAAKRVPGELRVPVAVRGVPIEPGDLVVADADGVAVVPGRQAELVRRDAEALAHDEERVRAGIEAGRSTLDLLGLSDAGR